jgi:hypothetical protein
MKLLYIGPEFLQSTEMIGVRKKISWQLEAINRLGIETWLAYGCDREVFALEAYCRYF